MAGTAGLLIAGAAAFYVSRIPSEKSVFLQEYRTLSKEKRVGYVIANLGVANRLAAEFQTEADLEVMFGKPDIVDREMQVWAWVSKHSEHTRTMKEVWGNPEYFAPFFYIRSDQAGRPLNHKIDTFPSAY